MFTPSNDVAVADGRGFPAGDRGETLPEKGQMSVAHSVKRRLARQQKLSRHACSGGGNTAYYNASANPARTRGWQRRYAIRTAFRWTSEPTSERSRSRCCRCRGRS
ncbi:methyltransferase FkbM domain protein [Mycobacterium kansasii]|uniref:Methyltransferase FkbM domain protein n=1 Tax=Mycobacterium kansasii TaxID=1768 RepID=A0A1V3XHQ6_MYCKA|nr:methyltransferase FkbM domain protein [Mycobacterium kansasii]